MTQPTQSHDDLSWDAFDEQRDPRPSRQGFDEVVDRAISRRGFLGGALAIGSGASVFGAALLRATPARAASFPFTPIGIGTDFSLQVPEGHSWKTLVRWGDALTQAAEGAFSGETGVALDLSTQVFGENTDGMELFQIDGKEVIAVNSEYVNPKINLPAASEGKPQSAEEVQLLKNLQGVTILEVADQGQGYQVVVGSAFNRRITNDTPMTMDGPVAGTDLVKTAADPAGMSPLGTLNNCGSGRTLWGTYLTCEENFNGYFGMVTERDQTPEEKRYGLKGESNYLYEKFDARFDLIANPNEPHRFGWVVEIDPADPASTPVKHTALGRFKHENAEMVQAADGRVVVYMGDDERGEFIYRYVSNGTWAEGQKGGTLLSEGTLYVARFNDDLTGEWLALTPESTGMDLAQMLTFARLAGTKVGATTMDRPEWIAAHPSRAEAYCALTNNSKRGGDGQPVNAANPREANEYGQIVRWRPEGGDHGADTFTWDLYVMAGNPAVHKDAYAGSANVTEGNMFNSPDGMAFDSTGMLWIQTDGEDTNEGDFAGQGNNQMLIGNPDTGEIARFLTAPNGAEVTGLCWSADRKVAFVGIQHPGGSWPDGAGKPRSSIVAVWRDDGATLG
ncbi:PhoX family protein [Xinfangfangia pollutisoli]|uniref:PhoX family protein n=1 Tax=Xinfangfangia pollutisoli TaxID=2865960 RepID=UPI001CD5CFE2|nr:PhoX family phosphatase [Xinfangfangia pollutisoli]